MAGRENFKFVSMPACSRNHELMLLESHNIWLRRASTTKIMRTGLGAHA